MTSADDMMDGVMGVVVRVGRGVVVVVSYCASNTGCKREILRVANVRQRENGFQAEEKRGLCIKNTGGF